jgi:Domain of unknown function (DUF4402)
MAMRTKAERMAHSALFIAVAAMLASVPLSADQNSAAGTASASANVTSGVTLSKTTDLDFGDVISGAAAGTVVVDTTGARTSGGSASLGSGATVAAASFDVNKAGAGNPHFSVSLPVSTTITSGANTMTVDTFVHNATAVPPYEKVPFTLNVGATLHVGANQPSGTYSGTFLVTITQE